MAIITDPDDLDIVHDDRLVIDCKGRPVQEVFAELEEERGIRALRKTVCINTAPGDTGVYISYETKTIIKADVEPAPTFREVFAYLRKEWADEPVDLLPIGTEEDDDD